MNKSKVTVKKSTGKRERIVIVGAGLAGLRAAERLRELDFNGEIVVVGEEWRRPYHRPALSKQMLTGELRPRDLTLRSYVPLDAIWRRGTQVLKLDTRRRVIEVAGEEEIRYDGLVIATGVQARHLAGAPRHDPRVHVLRTMGDAIALQHSIARGSGKVVVIGGGFTAGEVASTVRELGCDVTILSRSKVLLGKVVGNDMGERITELHRASGVRVETGVEVTNWLSQPWGISMHLSNGKVVVAGTVVLAVGSTPAVQWLRGSGLTLEDGVLCRPTCHVVGANDVVAAGDVARWPNLRFEATPRRVEHWMNAVDMGRAAAESLLAGPTEAEPFTPLPRFWSEQQGLHMQAAGMPALSQDTIQVGTKATAKGITGYVRNGRLIGIVGLDNPRGMLHWTAELKRELRRSETINTPVIPEELVPDKEPATESASVPAASPVVETAVDMTLEHPTMSHLFTELPAMLAAHQRQPATGRFPVPQPQAAAAPPMARQSATGQFRAAAPPERPSTRTVREHPSLRGLPPAQRPPAQRPDPRSAQGMQPVPRPEHPSRQGMQPVPLHPSMQGMPPVQRPEHPSMPGTQPVPRPEHPSMPGMQPVPRPEHHSVPGMQPVQRPGAPTMPGLRVERRADRHPSMPGMRPVERPMSEFERRREQQLLEWQFRQG